MQTIDLPTLKSHLEEDSIILDGLDDCIVGVCHNNRLVYGYGQLLKHFIFEGMSHSEAIEWIEYNICSLTGLNRFSILYELEYL